MNAKWFQHAQEITVAGLKATLAEHVPNSAYQEFCLWALSEANPYQETWLHAMGIPQFVYLTLGLIDEVVDEADQQKLLQYSVPINMYLIYEVVSDDLAIGLANTASDHPTHNLRNDLLLAFNVVMVDRLKGNPLSAAQLLKPVEPLADQISGFEQTLIPERHENIAQHYIKQFPHLVRNDLEFSIWPRLVANIETGAHMARSVANYRVGPIVVQGLVNRYRAVSALLEERDMGLTRRVHISTDAILVVPTLAYYIGVLAEDIRPIAEFDRVIEDGTLSEALYEAALLVRLLNDLGTNLLTQREERAAFLQALRHSASQNDLRFEDLLTKNLDEFSPMLTRLYKDISHGEFNVVMYGLNKLPAVRALPIFEQRLEYLVKLYAQSDVYLTQLLDSISTSLNDSMVSNLIARFVQFHAKLYTQMYTSPAGEYTVGA